MNTGNWIKTTDALPENGARVITAIKRKDFNIYYYQFMYYRHGRWLDRCNRELPDNDSVEAWKPVPPYRG